MLKQNNAEAKDSIWTNDYDERVNLQHKTFFYFYLNELTGLVAL